MALKIDNAKNILVLTETTSPGTPDSGTLAIYADASGSLRIVNDAGLDKVLAEAGSPPGIAAVSDDPSPTLGGDLTANGNRIFAATGTTSTPGFAFEGDTDAGIFGGDGTVRQVLGGSVQTSCNGQAFQLVAATLRLAINNQGSAPTPVIYFSSDTNTGIWHSAEDTLNLTAGGIDRFEVNSGGVQLNDSLNVNGYLIGDAGIGSPSGPPDTYIDLNNDAIYMYNGPSSSGYWDSTTPVFTSTTGTTGEAATQKVIIQPKAGLSGAYSGQVNIYGGANSTGSLGGRVFIRSGLGTARVASSSIEVADSTSGIILTGGTGGSASTAGSSVQINAGTAYSGGGAGGGLFLNAGNGRNTGAGGNIEVYAGDSQGASGTAGDVIIASGNANGGTDGYIRVRSLTTSVPGQIRFEDATGGQYVELKAPATVTTSRSITLPQNAPVNGYVLQTDGSGVTSWVASVSGASTLGELNDVALGSPLTTDEVLTYDGSNWVNQAAAGGNPAHQITYSFSTSTASSDPGSATIRFSTSSPITTTQLYVNDTTGEGIDAGRFWGDVVLGDQLYIKQLNDDTKYMYARVTGDPTDNTGWWTIPVNVGSGYGGTLPDSAATLGILKMPGKSLGFDANGNFVAGRGNSTGASNNICIGNNAGDSLSTSLATENICIGYNSGRVITSSDRNVAIGRDAMGASTGTVGGYNNVAIGRRAAYNISGTPNGCVALGHHAGRREAGFANVFIGAYSGNQTTAMTGSQTNVGIGLRALSGITSGDFNVGMGWYGGSAITTGSNNICIGKRAGPTTSVSDQLFINSATAASNTPLIHGDFTVPEATIHGILNIKDATAVATGVLHIHDSANSYKTVVEVATLAADTRFQLPSTNGSNGNVLQTDGAGNTSWAAAAAGSAPSSERIIIAGSPVSNVVSTTVTTTATSGSPSGTTYLLVFRNGMLLDEDYSHAGSPASISEDYAVTGTNEITFADGILEAGDKIKLISFA